MGTVFVSYSNHDSQESANLVAALREHGYQTWRYEDNSNPGSTYLFQIRLAITSSDVIVVLISDSSLTSTQIEKEIFLGHELGKPFVPILIGMTHLEFQNRKPDWRTALGAHTSIVLPVNGVQAIMSRIVAGLMQMGIQPTPKTPEPPTATRVASSNIKSPEASPRAQYAPIQVIDPEVQRNRTRIAAAWKQAGQQFAEHQAIGELHSARIQLADNLIVEIADYVTATFGASTRGLALVARGGYGRGVLSAGSDIDVTLFHDPEFHDSAEKFFQKFNAILTDSWTPVRVIKVAPIINTPDECQEQWYELLNVETVDLSPLVSYMTIRVLAGHAHVAEQVRQKWIQLASSLTEEQRQKIADTIASRFVQPCADSQPPRFDIKHDAGGLLEYTLARFLTELLVAKCVSVDPWPETVLAAAEYLLRLREVGFGHTSTHVIDHRSLDPISRAMLAGTATDDSVKDFLEELLRHRRKIRAHLQFLVDLWRDTEC